MHPRRLTLAPHICDLLASSSYFSDCFRDGFLDEDARRDYSSVTEEHPVAAEAFSFLGKAWLQLRCRDGYEGVRGGREADERFLLDTIPPSGSVGA